MYGLDTQNWEPYHNNNKYIDGFTFKTIKEQLFRMDYKDNFFDCIILVLAKRNTIDIIESIKEYYKMLKKQVLN